MNSNMVYQSKLKDVNSPVIIAKDITDDGKKEFKGFNSVLSMFKHIKKSEHKHFHEVIHSDNRHIYFDFDKVIDDVDDIIDDEEFISVVHECLIPSIETLFGVEIDYHDILITTSTTSTKVSYHVIIPKYNI